MKIFDYIFESSIKSSKTILNIISDIVVLAEDINSIKTSLVNLTKIVHVHQVALDDLCRVLEQVAVEAKKTNAVLPAINDDKKKDKPN